MIEIRWHGRGGQGAVTASQLLAKACVNQGMYAQAFAMYGPERRGSPVVAFTRIDNETIEIRANIYEPDIVVVFDTLLMDVVDVTAGLKTRKTIILNTNSSPEELKQDFPNFNISTIDATQIALDTLGVPITNTVMLGSLIKTSGIVNLDNIIEVVLERFDKKNVQAVKEAYEKTKILEI